MSTLLSPGQTNKQINRHSMFIDCRIRKSVIKDVIKRSVFCTYWGEILGGLGQHGYGHIVQRISYTATVQRMSPSIHIVLLCQANQVGNTYLCKNVVKIRIPGYVHAATQSIFYVLPSHMVVRRICIDFHK